jgi:hypothetical protein
MTWTVERKFSGRYFPLYTDNTCFINIVLIILNFERIPQGKNEKYYHKPLTLEDFLENWSLTRNLFEYFFLLVLEIFVKLQIFELFCVVSIK